MLFRLFQWFKDWRRSGLLGGRSNQWLKVRNEYLKDNPICEICGSVKKLEIHHKMPFYLKPELELNKSNLITLCEKNDCHLRFGHLYNFKSYNPDIEKDAEIWHNKIYGRP